MEAKQQLVESWRELAGQLHRQASRMEDSTKNAEFSDVFVETMDMLQTTMRLDYELYRDARPKT